MHEAAQTFLTHAACHLMEGTRWTVCNKYSCSIRNLDRHHNDAYERLVTVCVYQFQYGVLI